MTSNPPRGEITAYRPEDYEFFGIALKEAQKYGESYRIIQEKSGKYPDGTDRIIVSLFVEGGARGRAESAMRGGRQRHFDRKLYIETASYEGYESESTNPPRGEDEDPFKRLERYPAPPPPGSAEWDAAFGAVREQEKLAGKGRLPLPDIWNPKVLNFANASYVRSGIYDPILRAARKTTVTVHLPGGITELMWPIASWDEVFAPTWIWEEAAKKQTPLLGGLRKNEQGFLWKLSTAKSFKEPTTEPQTSESSNPPRGEAPIRQVDLILSQQINKAISDEIEAIRMYGRIADMATDPLHADARVVFKNIAKEEMRHKEVLEELAASLRQRLGT